MDGMVGITSAAGKPFLPSFPIADGATVAFSVLRFFLVFGEPLCPRFFLGPWPFSGRRALPTQAHVIVPAFAGACGVLRHPKPLANSTSHLAHSHAPTPQSNAPPNHTHQNATLCVPAPAGPGHHHHHRPWVLPQWLLGPRHVRGQRQVHLLHPPQRGPRLARRRLLRAHVPQVRIPRERESQAHTPPLLTHVVRTGTRPGWRTPWWARTTRTGWWSALPRACATARRASATASTTTTGRPANAPCAQTSAPATACASLRRKWPTLPAPRTRSLGTPRSCLAASATWATAGPTAPFVRLCCVCALL